MNPKLIIISHGKEIGSKEKIQNFPFNSYKLLCSANCVLHLLKTTDESDLPANICANAFTVEEEEQVRINSKGKRRIIIPQMTFKISESDSNNKKTTTCGIYICIYDSSDETYNNIKLVDYSYFLTKRTNTETLMYSIEKIHEMVGDVPLDAIDVYIWSCRGAAGECYKAATNPSAVNAFGHRIKNNNRRSNSKSFNKSKKSKRTKKSRRKTRKYKRI